MHVKMPNQKELARMLQLKMKDEHHSILKIEFDHLSRYLGGFSPGDIDWIVNRAITNKRDSLLREAKAYKKVSFQEGSVQYCICSPDDPDKANVSLYEVLATGFVEPKVSTKDLLETIDRIKPLVSPTEREKYYLFEKRMGLQ